jgi:hypothetical protein
MKRKIDECFAMFIEVPINSNIITICDDYFYESFNDIDNADKTQLKCIEALNGKCDGCYFHEETKHLCEISDQEYYCAAMLLCKATERKDRRNVIFKKIGE